MGGGVIWSEMLEQQAKDDPTMAKMKNPNASASGIYQMMIMKTVFGGMKERFLQKIKENNDLQEALKWLSDDAANCVKNHKNEMATIIRGLKHAMDKPDKKKLHAGFIQLLTRWMFQLFRRETQEKDYKRLVGAVTDEKGETMQAAEKIITEVLKEN